MSFRFVLARDAVQPARTGYPGRKVSGAIAQLEERLVCIQKARGSSPLSSTGQRPHAILRLSEQSQTKSQSPTRPGTPTWPGSPP
jgi:hypothetical protein